jgi:hypothetical protein
MGGEVHCLTKEIGAAEPVYISHAWYPDSVNQTTDYAISADIQTVSGISGATLYWSIDPDNGYQAVDMTAMGDHGYTANIPGQPYYTTVHYYIEATANSGKTMVKPIVAPDWAYNFLVHPDGEEVGIEQMAELSGLPTNIILTNNYPNPFNAKATIMFTLPEDSDVKLNVFDILGREVTTLVSGSLTAGEYSAVWDASDYSSGTYFYMIKAGDLTAKKKMLLIK